MKRKTPSLLDVASRIQAHLFRFEEDDKINTSDAGGLLWDYYHPGATVSGGRIRIWYVSHEGAVTLTAAQAKHYLAKLDAGFVGKHLDALEGK